MFLNKIIQIVREEVEKGRRVGAMEVVSRFHWFGEEKTLKSEEPPPEEQSRGEASAFKWSFCRGAHNHATTASYTISYLGRSGAPGPKPSRCRMRTLRLLGSAASSLSSSRFPISHFPSYPF